MESSLLVYYNLWSNDMCMVLIIDFVLKFEVENQFALQELYVIALFYIIYLLY